MVLLKVEELSHYYILNSASQNVQVLRAINFDVLEGNTIAIVGLSGSGKSTLLDILAGLVTPVEGRVLFQTSPDIKLRQQSIAYMMQDDALLPWIKVGKNALLGVEIDRRVTHKDIKRQKQLFNQFDLGDIEQLYPHQLSGGMRQRVALSRTILLDRQITLLDEPFSHVDTVTRYKLYRWLCQNRSRGVHATIIVTHNIEEAIILSDEVYVLGGKPGSIVERFQVPFSRPRDPVSLLGNQEFARLQGQIIECLD